MKKVIIASLLSLTLTGAALAGGAPTPNSYIQMPSKQGFVTGIEGGYAWIQTPSKNLYSLSDFTNGSNSYRTGEFSYGVHLGYDFALTPHVLLGPELGYYDNGYSQYKGSQPGFANKTEVTSSDFEAVAKLTYMWYNGWNIFGKGGVARVDQKFDSVQAFGTTVASNGKTLNKYKGIAAAGFGYEFANGFSFSLVYRHIFASSSSNFQTNANRAKKVYGVNAVMADAAYRYSE
jgi:hypothetical protein